MPRPVCCKCRTEFRKVKNGIFVIEMSGVDPYRIWAADLSKCLGCEAEIVADYGRFPVWERHNEGFDGVLERIRNTERTIECFEKPNQ